MFHRLYYLFCGMATMFGVTGVVLIEGKTETGLFILFMAVVMFISAYKSEFHYHAELFRLHLQQRPCSCKTKPPTPPTTSV